MKPGKTITTLLVVVALGACPASSPHDSPTPADAPLVRRWIWGVTVDDLTELDATVDALRNLRMRPTARVVFDEGQPAEDYVAPVTSLRRVADIMGELLDSKFVIQATVDEYRRRTREYVAALGDRVDIWEIGNEVNGDWLGASDDVVAKVTAAAEVVIAEGRTAAVTFHYAEGCSDSEHDMFRWIERHVTPALRRSLAYVFVSYYEDDCDGRAPDWNAVFHRLARMFPRAALGIGECGTTMGNRKAGLLESYYRLRPNEPRFVGGFFWWYFKHDMVPRERPLWAALDSLLVRPR